jgi:hypothetical protein
MDCTAWCVSQCFQDRLDATYAAEWDKPKDGEALLGIKLGDGEVRLAERYNGPAVLVSFGEVLEINIPLAAGSLRVIDTVGAHVLDARELGSAHLGILIEGF